MTTTAPADPPSPSPSGPAPGATSSPPPGAPPLPGAAAPAASTAPPAGSPFPSAATLALVHAPRRELERALQRGATPDVDALVGWELRGINATPLGAPPIARLLGIQKFIKGFYREAGGARAGRVVGYNTPVVQNVLDGRWRARPSDAAPRRFGFFEVGPVDATARDNEYLHAVLLDYGKGGNPALDPSRGLRDYLVQLDDDRWLGKAYYALGPVRIAVGYFLLERFRRGPAELPPRRG
ncbi:MAG TPA: hypothetical protein VFT22_30765 [Kofleriaceae bacterium]|nr:hypothetical protein [Kofleriaceae bacterium]